MRKIKELDKLECYLKLKNIPHERFDIAGDVVTERHQIVAYDENRKVLWDAICHYGSYGYEQGLLEVMGTIIDCESGDVEGWLTADDVIERIEKGGK